jgi:hypothetical protein
MSRNNERVLSDKLISDIQELMYQDLRTNPDSAYTLVNNMMDAYLTGEWGGFSEVISDVIEDYEDNILLTLNMEIREDLENQTEDHV